jgi:t-SNARE complex subunit (syntaxin)
VQLESLINSADSTFDKMRDHQNAFLNELKGNVNDLANQMTDLLSDYAKQANTQTERHLGVWAEHTTNYAQQMNSAAQALSSVVDEIEDKLSR